MKYLVIQRNKRTFSDAFLLGHKRFHQPGIKTDTIIIYIESVHPAKECKTAVLIYLYLVIGTYIRLTVNILKFKEGLTIDLS